MKRIYSAMEPEKKKKLLQALKYGAIAVGTAAALGYGSYHGKKLYDKKTILRKVNEATGKNDYSNIAREGFKTGRDDLDKYFTDRFNNLRGKRFNNLLNKRDEVAALPKIKEVLGKQKSFAKFIAKNRFDPDVDKNLLNKKVNELVRLYNSKEARNIRNISKKADKKTLRIFTKAKQKDVNSIFFNGYGDSEMGRETREAWNEAARKSIPNSKKESAERDFLNADRARSLKLVGGATLGGATLLATPIATKALLSATENKRKKREIIAEQERKAEEMKRKYFEELKAQYEKQAEGEV